MFLCILAFLWGDIFLCFFSNLPSCILTILLLFFSSFLYFKYKKYLPAGYVFLAFLVGFNYANEYAHYLFASKLPVLAGSYLTPIEGYVASLPARKNHAKNARFQITKYEYNHKVTEQKVKISLNFPENFPINVGEKWHLLVRLKPIHSPQNPGAFDYEAWSFAHGIEAAGYVISSSENKLIAPASYHFPLQEWRAHIQNQLQFYLPSSSHSPWLYALILGIHPTATANDWEILRATGTNHLMAIAGLHIGMLAGCMYAWIFFLWRKSSYLLERVPAHVAAMFGAFIFAFLYSALAGFSLPTVRAISMLALFLLAILIRREINVWHVWANALLFAIILNPFSILTESFWLSFATIALIIFGMHGRVEANGIWWKWCRVQWVIGVGLIPLTLVLFQECSLISFPANTAAIPWLAFLVLPFCFLSLLFLFISPALTHFLLWIADKNLAGLWHVLTWFAHIPVSTLHFHLPNIIIFILSYCGVLLLLAPRGFPGKYFSIIFFLPLFLYHAKRPNPGEIWFTLLDVGQGLSAVIETKQHVLIYDTGTGIDVPGPYLLTRQIHQIDMLVLSHADYDHRGGLNDLLQNFSIKHIKTSVPEKVPTAASFCLQGEKWDWDGIHFEFIYPNKNQLYLGNDSSCVLRVDNGVQSILLPGDIEKFAELQLLKDKKNLPATILVAPHHGSKTSGMKEFIEAVHPQFVLYGVGYRNRYRFPHVSVVQTYADLHVRQLNTADGGALQFKISKNKIFPDIDAYRVSHQHWWWDR